MLFAAFVGFFCVLSGAFAENKTIRLKNEHIVTPEKASQPKVRHQAKVSGLYLLQFNGHFSKDWEQTLATAGVRLARYVPEDAFICHLGNSDLDAIEALPFVRWVGEYRPDHKIHSTVRNSSLKKAANDSLDVSVLLSPLA
ncbi:MAG: in-like serine protease, partial [Verrucomicrobiales bacterium]|nr:in-like serine protease [Verrucomicrobiales bacterium]